MGVAGSQIPYSARDTVTINTGELVFQELYIKQDSSVKQRVLRKTTHREDTHNNMYQYLNSCPRSFIKTIRRERHTHVKNKGRKTSKTTQQEATDQINFISGENPKKGKDKKSTLSNDKKSG